jgi:hypothetical protein
MISVSTVGELRPTPNLAEPGRRKRVPSKYAESIRELTKVSKYRCDMSNKNFRKESNEKGSKEDMLLPISESPERDTALSCVLPSSSRKLRLSIIIRKQAKWKMRRATSMMEKGKEREKEGNKNVSLLDTLLQVVEQYKVDEENKRGEESPKSSGLPMQKCEPPKREGKLLKDQEDKYLRFYD